MGPPFVSVWVNGIIVKQGLQENNALCSELLSYFLLAFRTNIRYNPLL